jgi:nucleoside-diphosphate-sugar epimerase
VDHLPTHDPLSIVADVTRLKSEVGWSPSVDWTEGMAKTIAWWKQRLKECKNESTDQAKN